MDIGLHNIGGLRMWRVALDCWFNAKPHALVHFSKCWLVIPAVATIAAISWPLRSSKKCMAARLGL